LTYLLQPTKTMYRFGHSHPVEIWEGFEKGMGAANSVYYFTRARQKNGVGKYGASLAPSHPQIRLNHHWGWEQPLKISIIEKPFAIATKYTTVCRDVSFLTDATRGWLVGYAHEPESNFIKVWRGNTAPTVSVSVDESLTAFHQWHHLVQANIKWTNKIYNQNFKKINNKRRTCNSHNSFSVNRLRRRLKWRQYPTPRWNFCDSADLLYTAFSNQITYNPSKRISTPNRISIRSAVFAQCSRVTATLTYHATGSLVATSCIMRVVHSKQAQKIHCIKWTNTQ